MKFKIKFLLFELLIFIILGFSLFIYKPKIEDKDLKIIYNISTDTKDLINLIKFVKKYVNDNYYYFIILFCYLYIILQSLAIPGPIILSIISGSIFGIILGFILVSLCCSIGATICYLNSKYLFKDYILSKNSDKINKFNILVKKNNKSLFYFLLFLRITPIVPNFIINIGSPISEINIKTFFLSSFFGLMPLNIIHLNTGITIKKISTVGISRYNVLFLFCIGIISLFPIYLSKKTSFKIN